MTDYTTPSVKRLPEWKLLTEFVITNLSQSRRSLTNRIAEAIQDLNIQRVQKERIYELIGQMVNRAEQNEQGIERPYQMHIRIWLSAKVVDRAGWGFFIVEKRGIDFWNETIENALVVELFLYQEHLP